jgi:hypothetical protein
VKKFLPENLDKDAAREIASDEQKNNCREGNGVALPSRRAYPSGGNWMQEASYWDDNRKPDSSAPPGRAPRNDKSQMRMVAGLKACSTRSGGRHVAEAAPLKL